MSKKNGEGTELDKKPDDYRKTLVRLLDLINGLMAIEEKQMRLERKRHAHVMRTKIRPLVNQVKDILFTWGQLPQT